MPEKYFVLERENNDNQPLFSWDQSSDSYGLGHPVSDVEPVHLRLREPIPNEPEWVDYHRLPNPVVSPRIASVLKSFDMDGIQFVPATVRNPNDTSSPSHDYVFLHVWHRIQCIDQDSSTIRTNRSGKRIYSIDKFVIDTDAVEKHPSKRRLFFVLAEKTSIHIVHESVRDAIDAAGARGIRMIESSLWTSASTFDT